MTRPQKPNIRRIAFKKECYAELEAYLESSELEMNQKEFTLDLAALIDFLEKENYIGAYYIASCINERLKSQLPEWEKRANRHVPEHWEVPDIQLNPE